jgi:hypothetical protein
MLGGCGIANQSHSTAWTADIAPMPSLECARDAAASLPGVSRVEAAAKIPALDIYLRGGNDRFPDLYLSLPSKGPLEFRYPFYKDDDPRDRAVRDLAKKMAAACQTPDLPARLRKEHRSEWSPYLFNI